MTGSGTGRVASQNLAGREDNEQRFPVAVLKLYSGTESLKEHQDDVPRSVISGTIERFVAMQPRLQHSQHRPST